MKILFATNNPHKLTEVRQMAGDRFRILGLDDIGLKEDIPEDHDTLEGNALAKARYVHERTGMPVFADDTGLEAEALRGRPGVLSARYAGPEKNDKKNMEKLLSQLQGIENRKARFRTVIAFITDKEEEMFFEGTVNGHIATTPAGERGFGYDPVFIPEGFQQTFAELPPETKNRISHRYKAFSKFAAFLQKNYSLPKE